MKIGTPARAEYEAAICSRRVGAVIVPFREVSLDGWAPKIADCHNNVDRWVATNPRCEAVRGWITYISFGPVGVQLTAHSIVRDQNGDLFDITPVFEGSPRGGAFVEHPGDSIVFFVMKDSDIRCPSFDPAADAEALRALIDADDDAAVDDPEESA